MKYNLYLERLDNRGHDATSILSLRVDRNSPPVLLADFAGGEGSLYDGYGAVDHAFAIRSVPSAAGVVLAYTQDGATVQLETSGGPLAVDQQLRLEKDECAYRITHSNWWPARRLA